MVASRKYILDVLKTSRGYQYYFRCPEEGFPTFDVADKLEVRGDGSYVVAPPSVHPSGSVYEWVISPDEAELANPPQWLREQARLHGRTMQAEDVGEVIANGSRNKVLFSIAGTLRRRGLDEAGIYGALLGINQAKCETPLDENEVHKIAQSATRYNPKNQTYNPLPRDEGHKGSANLLLAGRVDLGQAIAQGIDPPDELEPDLLLDGKIHHFFGPSESGKTILALWMIMRRVGLYYNSGNFNEVLVYHDNEAIYVEHLGKEDGVVRFTFEMIEGLRIVEDEEQHEDSPQ